MRYRTAAAATAISPERMGPPICEPQRAIAETFYPRAPVFDRIDQIVDAGLYVPLPHGWIIGLADIINSADAIAAGGYKSVNMAGASSLHHCRSQRDRHIGFPLRVRRRWRDLCYFT